MYTHAFIDVLGPYIILEKDKKLRGVVLVSSMLLYRRANVSLLDYVFSAASKLCQHWKQRLYDTAASLSNENTYLQFVFVFFFKIIFCRQG